MRFDASIEVFPLAQVFAISRGARTEAQVVRVQLTDGDVTARGECVPYARYGETCESVVDQLKAVDDPFDHGGLRDVLSTTFLKFAKICCAVSGRK